MLEVIVVWANILIYDSCAELKSKKKITLQKTNFSQNKNKQKMIKLVEKFKNFFLVSSTKTFLV